MNNNYIPYVFVILIVAITFTGMAIIKALVNYKIRKFIAEKQQIKIEIGAKSASYLEQNCEDAVTKRNNLLWSADLLERSGNLKQQRSNETFILIQIKDLGFTRTKLNRKTTTQRVFKRLNTLGLKQCPVETPFEFLIQHKELIRKGMQIGFYMNPLSDHKFKNRILSVCKENNTLNLSPSIRYPNTLWFESDYVIAKV